MRIALVDDDRGFQRSVQALCQGFGARHCVHMETDFFSSGEEFLQHFTHGSYDLIFMDIYMGEMDGIAVASQIRSTDLWVKLVFLTTSSDFMPEAFSFHAFGYLTKPLDKDLFFQVLADVHLMDDAPPFVNLTSGRQTHSVFLDDILSVVTDAHYLEVKLKGGTTLRCRMTVSAFQTLVGNDPRFLCVNKGVLVNADYVAEMSKDQCVLQDQSAFPVKVRQSQKIVDQLRAYNFEKIRSQQRHSR